MANGVHDGHRERLRKRFMTEGLDNFQSHEILELLLFYAIPRRNTSELAHRLIKHFNSLPAVLEAPVEALVQVEGISTQSAVLISMILQVFRRYNKEKFSPPSILDTTEKLGTVVMPALGYLANEAVLLICMDGKLKLLDSSIITEGSVNSTDITVRMILQRALLFNASVVVLAHNHPSGLATPSKSDIATTIQIVRALRLADIELWDHLIVGDNDMVSMRDTPELKEIFL